MIVLAALLAGCAQARTATLPAPQPLVGPTHHGSAWSGSSEKAAPKGAAAEEVAARRACPVQGCGKTLGHGMFAGPGLSLRQRLGHQGALALVGGQGPRKDALDVHVILAVQYGF